MKLFDVLDATKNWRQDSARPAINNVTYSDAVMESFGVSASGTTVTATTAMRVSAVAACVAKISGAIVSMRLNTFKHSGGDVPEILARDDLWYKLNEQPSSMYTAAAFWESITMSQLLRGDAFALIKRGLNGQVRELLYLPWACVSPVREGGTVKYYVNMPTHNISTWFDPSDILHFTGLGFDDTTMRSMSVIQYGARGAIGNSLAMTEYAGKFFEGGAHQSLVIKAPGKMNPDQITLLQNEFVKKYSGLSNAHKLPLVLTEGLAAEKVSLSAADAQLIEGQKFNVLDICRAFGVPPHMVGETSGSTSWGSGLESMGRGFIQYTLQPWLIKDEQELNRKLYPRDSGKFIEFDRDALIEGDIAAQGEYYRKAIGGNGSGDGWMTVNEVRRRKRLVKIENGDTVFKSVTADHQAASQSAQNTQNMAEIRTMFNAANYKQEPVNITVAAPIVNVTLPEQPAHQVNNVINVPESIINVEAVMPEQGAPIINIAETVVNFEAVMPEIKAVEQTPPTVNVIVQPSDVVVNNTHPSKAIQVVERNKSDEITKTITTYES
jgi:HK97 family phage portal protein